MVLEEEFNEILAAWNAYCKEAPYHRDRLLNTVIGCKSFYQLTHMGRAILPYIKKADREAKVDISILMKGFPGLVRIIADQESWRLDEPWKQYLNYTRWLDKNVEEVTENDEQKLI